MAKVLIVRLDGIGDALVCTPLLAALLDAGHEVGFALSDRNRGIFTSSALYAEHVLERIPWPKHGSTPGSWDRARSEIAAARYDVALVASEEPQAYALARPVARRIGFWTGWRKPLKSVWVRAALTAAVSRGASVGDEGAHEVEIVFRLASGLHAEPVPTRDAARLSPLVIEPAPRRDDAIVVQLGAKWSAIGVDPLSAGKLFAALAQRGARFIVSAVEAHAALNAAPSTQTIVCENLAAWKHALASARVVVTPDTGAAHLAGMLGIPVVDCFPDRDACAHIARWHPWAAPYVALVASRLHGADGYACILEAVDAL